MILRRRQLLGVTTVIAVAAGCTTATPTSTPVPPTPVDSAQPPLTSSAPSVAATALPAVTAPASTFTSEKYRYSIALPAGWIGKQAFLRWDGTGSPGHDAAEVDQFHSSTGTDAWGMSTPTTKVLATFWAEQLAAAAAEHPCPSSLEVEVDKPITIDGEPAHLTIQNCPGPGGVRVGGAGVVADGSGYVFYLQHPQDDTLDPTDMSVFTTLLAGITLP